MKKSFKKVLVALICIAMLTSVLPVVSLAAGADETEIVFGTGGKNGGNSEVTAQYVGGIGGKAADDTAYAFVFGETPTVSSRRYEYDITEYTPGTDEFTYEFSMYADGDAVAWICYRGGNHLIRWDADGKFYYNYNNTMTEYIELTRGEWHKVAISFRKGNRFVFYVDGQLLTDFSGWLSSPEMLGFGYLSTSANGIVAYDDCVKYKELYTAHYSKPYYTDPALTAVDKTVEIADNVVNYDAELITTSDALLSKLASAETDTIRLYTDSTLATLITDSTALTGDEAIVVESANKGYAYYTLDNSYIAPAMMRVQLVRADDDDTISNDNWIMNVKVRDDCVTVYSHTENPTWSISSNELIEILSSNTGYELTYVDDNKDEVTTSHVTGGYIKASKDETVFYIPIAKSFDYEKGYSTAKVADVNVRYRNAYGQTPVTATNVAGNPATAFGFAVKGAGVTAGDRYDIYQLDENLSDAYDPNLNKYYKVTCTYTFNMYAEGDALLYFGSAKGMHIFDWMPNGDVYITRYEGGKSIKDTNPVCNLPRGQWYHVAYSQDRASNRGELYINGNRYVSETGLLPSWNYYKGISLCIEGNAEYTTDSVGDRVLFSDVEYHEGFYYRDSQDIDVTNATEDFVIDETTNTIYTQNITTIDALKEAVLDNTDASAVKVYADKTFAAEATELADTNVVFVTSANGIRFENFVIKPMSELPDPTVSVSTGTNVFTAKTSRIAEVNDGLTLWMASYDDNNKLISIKFNSLTSDDIGNEVTDNLANGHGATNVKAFLWRDGFRPVASASGDIPVKEEITE